MNRALTLLLRWYAAQGRSHLPWRQTRDPYRVLVSEFMLQQTQVDRVLPKYEAFIERFPDLPTLAAAPPGDVLRLWKGLGYNSRAVRLKQIAQTIVDKYEGRMPRDLQALRDLPGIGPYTAAAVRAFAFNAGEPAVDTNVRRVVHRLLHGLEHPPRASHAELEAQAAAMIPRGRGHDWNSAMMDLGATLCTARAPQCLICPLRTACAAAPIDSIALDRARKAHAPLPAPQNAIPFERTTRYARGRIVDRLRELPPHRRISLLDLHADLAPHIERSQHDVAALVDRLAADGVVNVDASGIALA